MPQHDLVRQDSVLKVQRRGQRDPVYANRLQIPVPIHNQLRRQGGHRGPLLGIHLIILVPHCGETAAQQQRVRPENLLVEGQKLLRLHQLPRSLGNVHQQRALEDEGGQFQLIQLLSPAVKMVRAVHMGSEVVEERDVVGIQSVSLFHGFKGLQPERGRAGKRMIAGIERIGQTPVHNDSSYRILRIVLALATMIRVDTSAIRNAPK